MAAYRRVYDSRHLRANYQEPGSAPKLYAGQSSMGYLYLLCNSTLLFLINLHDFGQMRRLLGLS